MRLLSAIDLLPSQVAQLKSADPTIEIRLIKAPWTKEDLLDTDFAIGFPPPELLKTARNLQFLQLTASGSERYATVAGHVQIASATGAYGPIVSEYMLAALLAFYHNLHYHRNCQLQHVWGGARQISLLPGKTVLILGTGDIGCCFAKQLQALGASVIGIVRSRCLCTQAFDRLCTADELDKLLPQADVVAICIPGTPENRQLFDLHRMGAMKQGSLLINVGRGSIVDTEALCQLLREGHLAGAILDVVDPEPLPPEHPLWGFENVILTPHDAGNFRAMPPELTQRIAEIACQNFCRFLQKLPPRNAIS